MEISGQDYPLYHGGEEQGKAGGPRLAKCAVVDVDTGRGAVWTALLIPWLSHLYIQGRKTAWGLSPTRSGRGKSNVSTI